MAILRLFSFLLALVVSFGAFPESDYGKNKVKIVDLSVSKKFDVVLGFDPKLNYRVDVRKFDEDLMIVKDLSYDYCHEDAACPVVPPQGAGVKIFTMELKDLTSTECPGPTAIDFVKYITLGQNEMKRRINIEFVCSSPVPEL